MRNRRPSDRRRAAGAGISLAAGALVVNVAAWVALSSVFPGLSLFPRDPGSRDTTPSAPTAPASQAVAAEATPADVVLRQVVQTPARDLFGRGWSTRPSLAAVTSAEIGVVYGSPFARGCGSDLPPRAVAAVSYSTAARSAHATVTVQLWGYGAGQASDARAALRTSLDQCPGRDGVDPYTYSNMINDAEGFAASSDAAGQDTLWLVWQRGDVLGALSYTTLAGASPSAAAAAAGHVDDILVRALEPVCPDLSPAADDTTRNPYVDGYRPFGRDVVVGRPDIPTIPAPQIPTADDLPTPDPVEHPELAPPLPARAAEYLDLDGDGFAETPPPVEQARRGDAPVYADPASFVAPDGAVTAETAEPAAPTPPPASTTIHIPLADVTGPGCGWAFTGQNLPEFDTATLKKRGQAATTEALTALTEAAAAYRADQMQWAEEYTAWAEQQGQYDAYQRFLQAAAAAQQAASEAQYAYDIAVAAYELPRTPSPTQNPTPTPEPTPTPDPEPTTTPTPDPTETPTPTPDPTSSPTPEVTQ